MTLAEIIGRSAMLPPIKQQELADFAEFLMLRYGQSQPVQKLPDDDAQRFAAWLAGEIPPVREMPAGQDDACGLWRDRPEMEDSTEYVRNLRANWRNRQS